MLALLLLLLLERIGIVYSSSISLQITATASSSKVSCMGCSKHAAARLEVQDKPPDSPECAAAVG